MTEMTRSVTCAHLLVIIRLYFIAYNALMCHTHSRPVLTYQILKFISFRRVPSGRTGPEQLQKKSRQQTAKKDSPEKWSTK